MTVPVSVIIPVGPNDTSWRKLLPHLHLPDESEIILAAGRIPASVERAVAEGDVTVRICTSGQGRAGQMNAGAALAQHEWLWFLHADSRPGDNACLRVSEIASDPDTVSALYYFDLRFMTDGPQAMKLNERAVRWRSGTLQMPFGDQGFLMKREVFDRVGGYREDVAYGEDHLFVWAARLADYPVLPVGADLFTSARKYRDGGWLNTTALHLWLTVRQGVPQALALFFKRVKGLLR